MRRLIILMFLITAYSAGAQTLMRSPCQTNPVYRQFDFWIGNWEVYGLTGKLAGNSKIELILDSCVVLENWQSINNSYSGKSFNSYNAATGQWQQNWVDSRGGSIEYVKGNFSNGVMVFYTAPFPFSNDTIAVRRLSFHSLTANKVRQHAEISKDGQKSWVTEYDLEYRRKEN